jgi:signal transduction histidine kinase
MGKTYLKQQVRSEDKIEGRELFSQLLRNYPGGSISIVDKRCHFLFAGGDLHSALGADPSELVGGEMFPNLPQEMRRLIKDIIKNAFKGVTIAGFELPAPIKGHYYVMDALPLRRQDGSVAEVGIIIRDISSLKKVEQDIRRSLQKEKELSELKSRFITMASHEFRTPLTAILSSAQVLKSYARAANINVDRQIQGISSSVGAITELLEDFLSVQKMEEGSVRCAPRNFNVRDHITTAITVLETTNKKSNKIIYTHLGDEIVFLDPVLLRQIIINLLSNAIKFSPEGAPIEVTTEVGPEKILITVKDNGIGIPAEYRDHAFERFYRAANVENIQGTGLGLHVAKTYTTMMNGVIDYTSDAEEGTQFYVQFNLARQESGAAADRAA